MRRRWPVNISTAERLGRVAVGLLGVIGGVALLAASAPFLVSLLEVILVLAGLDLIVTGVAGHCPLYQKLGHLPRSLRRPA